MQVSIACTDHNLKRGNGGDHGKQSTTSPNVVNQARAKFRTVAIIARSFGSYAPRHISLKESTGKHTGMKYRGSFTINAILFTAYPGFRKALESKRNMPEA
ncbi:hypothetical protein JOQ06_024754 [Pogonophryne albipinna]|uniref:Voltage-gated potassium channel subunit beta-1 n=1 Tax=Pogonophryne albipinna TaxID=1090488 RepID=A0AAD6F6R8_9TELE|nr:hypothetical protein JOQ06_024754 [Pogonophryne albipinna]